MVSSGPHAKGHYHVVPLCSAYKEIFASLGGTPQAIFGDRDLAGYHTGRAAVLRCPCPHCGARMIVIEVFAPRWRRSLSAQRQSTSRSPVDTLHATTETPHCTLHTHPGRPVPASRPPSGAKIKSHSARCPAGAKLPATSWLGVFWTPAA